MRRYRKAFRARGGSHSEYENVALLGDFNIFSTEDETFKKLRKNGFLVPKGLHGKITNVGQEARAFDQIAFLEDEKTVESTGNSGAIDFFRAVYRKDKDNPDLDDKDIYVPAMRKTIDNSNKSKSASKQSTPWDQRSPGKQSTYYGAWRTFQMSDHLSLWVELKIDFSEEYLLRKAEG